MLKKPKGSPFYIFRHFERLLNFRFSFFFENFQMSLKGSSFNFWDNLQQGMFKNPKGSSLLASQFGSPLSFSGTVEENTGHFEVLVLFLSLRYGAGFCRSRLVSYPLQISICSWLRIIPIFNYEFHFKLKIQNFNSS